MNGPLSLRLVLAAAAGGGVGALVRHLLTVALPAELLVTLAINVTGCFALALLPAWPRVRHTPWLAVALGPGLLGGYTTLSTHSVQALDLAGSSPLLAVAYVAGTLVGCLAAVALAGLLWAPGAEAEFAAEEGEE